MKGTSSFVRVMASAAVALALTLIGQGRAEAITITYDAGSGTPLSYTESGFTWTSLQTHLHMGDHDGDGSPDLMNHSGCCSTPYRLTYAGGNFTLNSTMFVGFFDGSSTWTGSNAAVFIDPGGPGDRNVSFGSLFANVSYVDFDVAGSSVVIDNTVVNASAVPEPGSLMLMGSGLVAGVLRLRRRATA